MEVYENKMCGQFYERAPLLSLWATSCDDVYRLYKGIDIHMHQFGVSGSGTTAIDSATLQFLAGKHVTFDVVFKLNDDELLVPHIQAVRVMGQNDEEQFIQGAHQPMVSATLEQFLSDHLGARRVTDNDADGDSASAAAERH